MSGEQERSNKALFLIHSFILQKEKKDYPLPSAQIDRERAREFEGEGKRKAGILIDAFWKGASAAGVPASKVLQHFHVLRSARFRSLGGKTESEHRRGHLTRKGFGIKTAFFTNLQFIPRDEEKRKKKLEKKERERERRKTWRTGERKGEWKREISVV